VHFQPSSTQLLQLVAELLAIVLQLQQEQLGKGAGTKEQQPTTSPNITLPVMTQKNPYWIKH